jgi:drug/metabolite transporter (DMT)-like permease
MLIGYRFLIAGLLGLLVFKMNPFKISKEIYKHSLVLSSLLMVIYVSSTYGLKYTSASNAGFIIGSSVILVPINNGLIYKEKLSRNENISSLICFIGLALVTLKGTT